MARRTVASIGHFGPVNWPWQGVEGQLESRDVARLDKAYSAEMSHICRISLSTKTRAEHRCCRLLRHMMLLALLAAAFCQTGCVYRRMTIRSNPPGALVKVDGDEIGYTPCAVEFTYYGTREITLTKPGYETLTTLQKVSAPWYQYPVIEFVADNLSPVKVTNRHEFSYTLQPQVIVPTDELLERAKSHRSESQMGR